jgi:hypothetical protein
MMLGPFTVVWCALERKRLLTALTCVKKVYP